MADSSKRFGIAAALTQFLKLALSFAPWLAFMLLARGSLLQVKIALLVGATLAIALAVARVNKGVILWVTLAFFAYATLAIAVFDHMWTLRHLGVLANGTLGAAAWGSILLGKPFTLEYAKEHTAPQLWSDPGFVVTNNVISSVWAAALSVNAGFALAKMARLLAPQGAYDLASYATLIAAAVFTVWYPAYVHRKAAA